MDHMHNFFSVFCLVVEPNDWEISEDVSGWIEARSQITGEPRVVSLTMVNCIGLLEICNIVDTWSESDFSPLDVAETHIDQA